MTEQSLDRSDATSRTGSSSWMFPGSAVTAIAVVSGLVLSAVGLAFTASGCASGSTGEASSYDAEQARREARERKLARARRAAAQKREGTTSSNAKDSPVVLQAPEFAQVAPASSANCLLETDGTIRCWDGKFEGKQPPDHNRLVRLDAGARHFCGLTKRGHVECWGANGYSQSTPPREAGFVQLDSGEFHTCARKTDGSIHCWGATTFGKGRDEIATKFPASSADGWRDIAGGIRHTCALDVAGTVTCRGHDADGRLNAPSDVSFTSIDAFKATTCGVTETGDIHCWGKRSDEIDSGKGAEFSKVSVADRHVCGLRTDNSITCERSSGLGPGSPRQYAAPDGSKFVGLQAGGESTCAVTRGDRITCWPYISAPTLAPFEELAISEEAICAVNADGHIHCMSYTNRYGFAAPPSEGHFETLAIGLNHSCAIKQDRSVACWGLGELEEQEAIWETEGRKKGCLRDYAEADCNQARPPDIDDAVGIDTEYARSCAVHEDGALSCWGRSTDQVYKPPADLSFKQVVLEAFATCGIVDSGDIECWGKNPPPDDNYVQVDAGRRLICGLTNKNRIRCEGFRIEEDMDLPDKSSKFRQLSVGRESLCAITTDGELRCWGRKHWPADEFEPYLNQETYRRVAVSAAGVCAIRQDGALRCAGAVSDSFLDVRD